MAQENPKMHKFLWLFLLISFGLQAQQKPSKIKHLHSDKIQKKTDMYNGNLFFTGNVVFQQDAAVLKADTVVFYEKKTKSKLSPMQKLPKVIK